jgi:hypothetical protein
MKIDSNCRVALIIFWGMAILSFSCYGQETQPSPVPGAAQGTASSGDAKPAVPSSLAATFRKDCVEPEPTFTGLEYNGPFKKLIVHIAGKPEIRTVEHPRDHSGKPICSLPVQKKFMLFAKDTFEPVTFGIAGFNAGLAQAMDDDPTFGQGGEGYGRRFGAAFADQVSGEFFGTFVYPTLLHEDPRYYRLGHGTPPTRFIYAVEHAFITHTDSGKHTFNFSEWMAASSTTALGNLYHPGNHRGFQPAARGTAYSVAFDVGFDILREFWPEITQHLRLPFVVRTHPVNPTK